MPFSAILDMLPPLHRFNDFTAKVPIGQVPKNEDGRRLIGIEVGWGKGCYVDMEFMVLHKVNPGSLAEQKGLDKFIMDETVIVAINDTPMLKHEDYHTTMNSFTDDEEIFFTLSAKASKVKQLREELCQK